MVRISTPKRWLLLTVWLAIVVITYALVTQPSTNAYHPIYGGPSYHGQDDQTYVNVADQCFGQAVGTSHVGVFSTVALGITLTKGRAYAISQTKDPKCNIEFQAVETRLLLGGAVVDSDAQSCAACATSPTAIVFQWPDGIPIQGLRVWKGTGHYSMTEELWGWNDSTWSECTVNGYSAACTHEHLSN